MGAHRQELEAERTHVWSAHRTVQKDDKVGRGAVWNLRVQDLSVSELSPTLMFSLKAIDSSFQVLSLLSISSVHLTLFSYSATTPLFNSFPTILFLFPLPHFPFLSLFLSFSFSLLLLLDSGTESPSSSSGAGPSTSPLPPYPPSATLIQVRKKMR